MRFALIGTGSMGKKYGVMLNSGMVKNATLTAVVCRSEENRSWAEETLKSTVRIYADTEELFNNPQEYDAVLIVTPHKTHPELAIRSFELEKHVFCDKPAGVSVLQARKMNEAAIQSGKLYGMMFHQRLYKKYIRLKEIIDSNQLGEITRVMLVNSRYYRTSHYHKSGSWRSSWNGEGGGALINQGQHIIDIWQWLFGMPESVYANIPFGKYNDFAVDDEATIMMKYPNKMSAVFVLTTGEVGWEERLEIIGTCGSILLEDDTLTITRYSKDSVEYGKTATVNSRENLTCETVSEQFEKQAEPYAEMFENFAAAQKEDDLVAPGNAGFLALQITNAAYLSAWKNETISLPVDEKEYELELKKQIEQELKSGMEME